MYYGYNLTGNEQRMVEHELKRRFNKKFSLYGKDWTTANQKERDDYCLSQIRNVCKAIGISISV